MMIRAIIFDYNGVLTTRGTFTDLIVEYCQQMGKDSEGLATIVTSRWKEARIGKVEASLLWKDIAGYLGYNEIKLREEWIERFPVRLDMLDKIKYYKNSHKIGLLTNEVRDWMEPAIEMYGLQDCFDVIVTSYEEGVAKPDARIFEIMLKRLKVQAQDCVYIDDQLKNTTAATGLGFKTILFSSVGQMEKDLKLYGVL